MLYQLENRLNSDSEVLERALRALRELELTAAYREFRRNPDAFVDTEIGEGLEPSDGKEWL